jgi:TolA-binding protein
MRSVVLFGAGALLLCGSLSFAAGTREDDEDLWANDGTWKHAPSTVDGTPEKQLRKARNLEKIGAVGQAAEEYKRLAERYPEADAASEALVGSARCFLSAGDFTRCREQLDELRRRWRSIPPEYLDALGKVEIGLANGFLDGRGEGGTYRLGSRVRKARRIYERLLTDDPQGRWADDAQLGLGRCKQILGQWEAAVEEYKKLLKNYPHSSLRAEAEGGIAVCLGRREPRPYYAETETTEALRRIRETKAEAAEPRRTAVEADEPEDLDLAALEEFEQMLEDRQAEKRFLLGRFYAVNGRFRAAEITFERVGRLHPKTEWAARAAEELKKIKNR